eukprot:TRINITY_DN66013_c9_g2_i1.p2 TRINITY_DN66013_c9_g2~~TRINITY_DN66013_c9_g2_i1.p2  ORF type:complete len:231 (-),score=105.03 TRINITY_DN66013_c9_g2_i1:253-903(-)
MMTMMMMNPVDNNNNNARLTTLALMRGQQQQPQQQPQQHDEHEEPDMPTHVAISPRTMFHHRVHSRRKGRSFRWSLPEERHSYHARMSSFAAAMDRDDQQQAFSVSVSPQQHVQSQQLFESSSSQSIVRRRRHFRSPCEPTTPPPTPIVAPTRSRGRSLLQYQQQQRSVDTDDDAELSSVPSSIVYDDLYEEANSADALSSALDDDRDDECIFVMD